MSSFRHRRAYPEPTQTPGTFRYNLDSGCQAAWLDGGDAISSIVIDNEQTVTFEQLEIWGQPQPGFLRIPCPARLVDVTLQDDTQGPPILVYKSRTTSLPPSETPCVQNRFKVKTLARAGDQPVSIISLNKSDFWNASSWLVQVAVVFERMTDQGPERVRLPIPFESMDIVMDGLSLLDVGTTKPRDWLFIDEQMFERPPTLVPVFTRTFGTLPPFFGPENEEVPNEGMGVGGELKLMINWPRDNLDPMNVRVHLWFRDQEPNQPEFPGGDFVPECLCDFITAE